ncbi:hypothetical protein GQR58_013612 [Nymphon striatum]|nr:hypothetical protein GQR58_013612 [Nymphon striatum]
MTCERSEFVTNAYEDTANVAKFERLSIFPSCFWGNTQTSGLTHQLQPIQKSIMKLSEGIRPMCPACTNVWVRDLGNYRYPVEKIGECPTQYGKKDPRCELEG